MEHEITAPAAGRLEKVTVQVGDFVAEGVQVATLAAVAIDGQPAPATTATCGLPDLDDIRSDIAEIRDRHEADLDAARPEASARRHLAGKRTARENLADLSTRTPFVNTARLSSRRNVDGGRWTTSKPIHLPTASSPDSAG